MTTVYKPGDVVTLDFPGGVVTKRRPAVIVSSDARPRRAPRYNRRLNHHPNRRSRCRDGLPFARLGGGRFARPFCFPRLPRHRPAYCHLRTHRAIVCERLASRPRAGAPRARTAGCARFTLTACSPITTASRTKNSTSVSTTTVMYQMGSAEAEGNGDGDAK